MVNHSPATVMRDITTAAIEMQCRCTPELLLTSCCLLHLGYSTCPQQALGCMTRHPMPSSPSKQLRSPFGVYCKWSIGARTCSSSNSKVRLSGKSSACNAFKDVHSEFGASCQFSGDCFTRSQIVDPVWKTLNVLLH